MAFNAIACNWETAAVLKTAALNRISSVSLRAITDTADREALHDYRNNLNRSLDMLSQLLRLLISDGWAYKIITSARLATYP
jgi:nucleoside phosphorylase